MIGYIYQIENLITHECYIGQTIDINRRKNTHFSTLRNNKHDNPKLQNAWNKYGAQEFHFRYWEYNIDSLETLNELENEFIKKFDSINNGYNILPGGGKPPLRQKVKNEDIIKFLCIEFKYGSGFGHTCEKIFNWSKGTASAALRKKRYIEANDIFSKMTDEEKDNIATLTMDEFKLDKERFDNQRIKNWCSQSIFKITKKEVFIAFAAQELGYGYSATGKLLNIKPATIKDWFSGRSRVKDKNEYISLNENEKEKYRTIIRNSNIKELQNEREKQLYAMKQISSKNAAMLKSRN